MRAILFRGKRYNGAWLAGDLLANKYERPNICPIGDVNCYPVIPETVGQYTGMKDEYGRKIFEGDIVSHFSNYSGHRVYAVVTYTDGQFLAMTNDNAGLYLSDKLEVIGNIFDNPELLKGEENE